MTPSIDAVVSNDTALELPEWCENKEGWGEKLVLPEWQDDDYRTKNGWKGRDFCHDKDSAVRILDYFVQYGPGHGLENLTARRGGLDTQLTGICVCTDRAESHAGYCHGGSFCALLDDVIGWTAFCITGTCRPWSGYTVQVQTNLLRPIPVQSTLLLTGIVTKIERRKVWIKATLKDPANDDMLHATAEGMVVLNRGVLPLPNRESMDESSLWPGVSV